MKKILYEMLSANGKLSSKRIITLLAFLMMAMGFIANLFWDATIEEMIYDSMTWVVLGGLGFTASEHFSHKKPQPQNDDRFADEEDVVDEEDISPRDRDR